MRSGESKAGRLESDSLKVDTVRVHALSAVHGDDGGRLR